MCSYDLTFQNEKVSHPESDPQFVGVWNYCHLCAGRTFVNMRPIKPNANRIDKDIKQDFARDPMMQKLHQIRHDFARDKTLAQTLKAITAFTRKKSRRMR